MDAVKRQRTYDSPRRREQAAATRRAILAAAQRLFEQQGYGATSVPAIADEAGVAVKTVYLAFETKAKLLRALWDHRLSGEEAGIPLNERASYRAVLEEPGAERQLRMLAARSRAIKTRSGALMEVIRNATTVDVEIALLWEEIQQKLFDAQSAIIERLYESGELATDPERARDILWTLNHPSVWQLLVRERHWTGKRYEQWLADILCSQLLKGGSPRA